MVQRLLHERSKQRGIALRQKHQNDLLPPALTVMASQLLQHGVLMTLEGEPTQFAGGEIFLKPKMHETVVIRSPPGQETAFIAYGPEKRRGIAIAPLRGLESRFQDRGERLGRSTGPAFFGVQPKRRGLQDTPPDFGGNINRKGLGLAPAFEQNLDAFIVELVPPPR